MIIDLDEARPIATGGKRDIYLHPHDPGLVIKVISARRQNKQNARSWRERLYKPRYEWEFIREIKTVYRASLLRHEGEQMPIISASGLVQTSRGLGLSAEKITDADGGLAPRLSSFLDQQDFEAIYLPKLNRFIQDVFRFRIVASDLNCSNIVYSGSEERFVAIDGFGSRTLIPIMVWSRKANERQLNATIEKKIANRTRLKWNKEARQFEL